MNVHSVRVARIGRPHGIRGEVTVEVFTDSPDTRFAVGNILQLVVRREKAPQFEELTVENSRWNKKILLLKFAEFSDRNTAETLRESELYAPAENLLDDAESWYADELAGLHVYEGSFNSSPIGKVVNLITGDAQDLLEIQLSGGREILIPFVKEIVPEIDVERGAVVITPPPGLLELNQD